MPANGLACHGKVLAHQINMARPGLASLLTARPAMSRQGTVLKCE